MTLDTGQDTGCTVLLLKDHKSHVAYLKSFRQINKIDHTGWKWVFFHWRTKLRHPAVKSTTPRSIVQQRNLCLQRLSVNIPPLGLCREGIAMKRSTSVPCSNKEAILPAPTLKHTRCALCFPSLLPRLSCTHTHTHTHANKYFHTHKQPARWHLVCPCWQESSVTTWALCFKVTPILAGAGGMSSGTTMETKHAHTFWHKRQLAVV